MERVLKTYARPLDPLNPVVCFDERPCFLIGDKLDSIAMETGKVAKEHYEYVKNGCCSLLMATEPKTGVRVAEVYSQRTKKEFTDFMQKLSGQYPDAQKITVILDNLNTHNFGSFYEHLSAEEASVLSDRFEFIHTPKSGSWLNMQEVEFSAISRLCLKRRIGQQAVLRDEVLALVEQRKNKGILLTWQFTVEQARDTLKRHYSVVNSNHEIL
jgi:hypothetical protein